MQEKNLIKNRNGIFCQEFFLSFCDLWNHWTRNFITLSFLCKNFCLLKYEHKKKVLLEFLIIEIIFFQSKWCRQKGVAMARECQDPLTWKLLRKSSPYPNPGSNPNFEKIKFCVSCFAQLLLQSAAKPCFWHGAPLQSGHVSCRGTTIPFYNETHIGIA